MSLTAAQTRPNIQRTVRARTRALIVFAVVSQAQQQAAASDRGYARDLWLDGRVHLVRREQRREWLQSLLGASGPGGCVAYYLLI